KRILNLAIPNIITNITVPLLGMTDTAIAGRLESELCMGAMAVAAVIFNFIYWNFSFLRMGTSGFTAQAFGAGNRPQAVSVLLRSLSVAFIAGALIIMFQQVILRVAFFFIQAGAQTQAYTAAYFHVYIWAAPFVLGTYAITGWYIGMQDAQTPLFISIAANVINIGLSLLFVFVFNMQIKGVALGSACAQFLSFCLALLIWNKKYGRPKPFISRALLRPLSGFKPFFKVNGAIFLRSLALAGVTVFFTSASAKMGDTVLAVNSLLMQLFILFSYMMDGFAHAAEALAGRYYGAKNNPALIRLVRYLFLWGGAVTLLFTALYALFTDMLLQLLTDKVHIIEASAHFRLWPLLFPIAGFAAFLWDGIFVGITASRQMRDAMFVAVAFFFIIYYTLTPLYGNNGLWLSFIAYLAMRGIMQTLLFERIRRKATR
ncbi:MAG: MATE family efflux transporter, partial [Tannerellaceae bacterium]|nr:MATE family efflux transporter [Tannerellaceae bacterium]